jgi:hypothetical protein
MENEQKGMKMVPEYFLFGLGLVAFVMAVFLYQTKENNDYAKLVNVISDLKGQIKAFDSRLDEIQGDITGKLADLDAMQTVIKSDLRNVQKEHVELKDKIEKVQKMASMRVNFAQPLTVEIMRKQVTATPPQKIVGRGKEALLPRAGITTRSKMSN